MSGAGAGAGAPNRFEQASKADRSDRPRQQSRQRDSRHGSGAGGAGAGSGGAVPDAVAEFIHTFHNAVKRGNVFGTSLLPCVVALACEACVCVRAVVGRRALGFWLWGGLRRLWVSVPPPLQVRCRADIARCYESDWNKITERFYQTARWPEVEQIEDLCKRGACRLSRRRAWLHCLTWLVVCVGTDHVFMVLYRLLYYRHVMFYLAAKNVRAGVADHLQALAAYTDFFNIALAKDYAADVELPAQWLYELLSDFILHFQSFLRLRVAPELLDEDEREQLNSDLGNQWSLLDVMHPLYVLAASSDIATTLASRTSDSRDLPSGLLNQLGYFSLVCLCRLHCLVGDYAQALRIISPLNLQNEALFSTVPSCHITLFYYVGFALIMSRRYVEAMRAYGRVLLYFHRTKKYVGCRLAVRLHHRPSLVHRRRLSCVFPQPARPHRAGRAHEQACGADAGPAGCLCGAVPRPDAPGPGLHAAAEDPR